MKKSGSGLKKIYGVHKDLEARLLTMTAKPHSMHQKYIATKE